MTPAHKVLLQKNIKTKYCNDIPETECESRVRQIKTPPQHNGRTCTGEARQEEPCNKQKCPGI